MAGKPGIVLDKDELAWKKGSAAGEKNAREREERHEERESGGRATIAGKGGAMSAGKADSRLKAKHNALAVEAGSTADEYASNRLQATPEKLPAEPPAPDASVPTGVLVVRCDVSPEAARNQTFDKLLLANDITFEGDTDRLGSATVRLVGAMDRGDGATFRQARAKAAGGLGMSRQEVAEGLSLEAKKLREPFDGRALDVIYVEATPGQIAATLSALAAKGAEFPSVVVEPAPDVASQRSLVRFNRRKALPADADEPEAAQDAKRQVQGKQRSSVAGQQSIGNEQQQSQAGWDGERRRSPASYRALFVLRTVGPSLPGGAGAAAANAAIKADASAESAH